MSVAMSDRPACGGLVIWKDEKRFVHLDRGNWGRNTVRLYDCRPAGDEVRGRGCLVADRVTLRLERRGDRVTALCSPVGDVWFTVGSVDLAVDDPIEIGVYACGAVDAYPGAFSEGTAIRFESFRLERF